MSREKPKCKFVLAYFNGSILPEWTLELADDDEVLLGTDVDGPGRLQLPGMAPLHARVGRNRTGVWIQPEYGARAWLNSLPLFENPVTLVKGDRIRLGLPGLQNELVTTCTADLQELGSEFGLPFNERNVLEIDSEIEDLSPAEYEVFAWVGRGVTELDEIANRLCRSVNTVRTQISRVYEKLNVHSKAELLGVLLRYRNELEKCNSLAGNGQGVCGCFR